MTEREDMAGLPILALERPLEVDFECAECHRTIKRLFKMESLQKIVPTHWICPVCGVRNHAFKMNISVMGEISTEEIVRTNKLLSDRELE
jgi:rubredoxin